MGGPLLSIDFSGAPEVKRMIKRSMDSVRPGMAAGLYQLGSAIVSDSVPRAPKDTGTLRNSAYCTLPTGSGQNVVVTGGYGGFAKKYAWVQHENMKYRHTEGGPKYLQRSFDKFAPKAAQWLANFMRRALERGAPALVGTVPSSPGGSIPGARKKKLQEKKKQVKKTAKKLVRAGAKGAKRALKKGVSKTKKAAKKAIKRATRSPRRRK